jgi:hypothetical protein
MDKVKYLAEIQKRLPDDIIIVDETNFDFTEDEYVIALSWIANFNVHYKEHGKSKFPNVVFAMVSKRLRLDFGLYLASDGEEPAIYLSSNIKKPMSGKSRTTITYRQVIKEWNL